MKQRLILNSISSLLRPECGSCREMANAVSTFSNARRPSVPKTEPFQSGREFGNNVVEQTHFLRVEEPRILRSLRKRGSRALSGNPKGDEYSSLAGPFIFVKCARIINEETTTITAHS